MNRLSVAVVLLLALAGCASAPPASEPVAADPASCTGDRFYEGVKTYARCIRHVATPPHPLPPNGPGARTPEGEAAAPLCPCLAITTL